MPYFLWYRTVKEAASRLLYLFFTKELFKSVLYVELLPFFMFKGIVQRILRGVNNKLK
jgi:hypothetical protein